MRLRGEDSLERLGADLLVAAHRHHQVLNLDSVLLAGADDFWQFGKVEGVLVARKKVFCRIRYCGSFYGETMPVVGLLAAHTWVFPFHRQAVRRPTFQGQIQWRIWSCLDDDSLCLRHSLESLEDTNGSNCHIEAGRRWQGIEEEGGHRGTYLVLHS